MAFNLDDFADRGSLRVEDFVLQFQQPPSHDLKLIRASVIRIHDSLSCDLAFEGAADVDALRQSRVLLPGHRLSGSIYDIRVDTDIRGHARTYCRAALLPYILASKGADMPTAGPVPMPPQYSPGDVVATSDGVEWLIEAIKGSEADLVRFKGPSHDHATRSLMSLKLLRKGDLRSGRPPLAVLKKSDHWWVQRAEDKKLVLHNIKVEDSSAFYDYAPFTADSWNPLRPFHATASYCPANADGVALPWSSLDVAAAPAPPAQPMKDVEFRESPIASGRLDLIEAHFRVNGGKWQCDDGSTVWIGVDSEGMLTYTYFRDRRKSHVERVGSLKPGDTLLKQQRPVLDDSTPVTWTSLERAKVVNVGDTVVCSEFKGSPGFVPEMVSLVGKEGVVTRKESAVLVSHFWWPIEAVRVIRRAAKSPLTSAVTSDTVTKSPIATTSITPKETPMPPAPTTQPDTLSSRFVAALKEGARRAPVEEGVDRGHEMLKELLISAGGAESPREEGIIREYVTRLLASNYGKAIGAYTIGELLHLAAPHLGKRAGLAQAAGREFANRAATIAEKEAGSSLLALFPKGISMLDELLNSFAGGEGVEVVATPQQLSGSTGELSRVMAAAVAGAGAEKVAV